MSVGYKHKVMNNWNYNIPAEKKHLVDDYLAKLNKKAEKLNLPSFYWNWKAACSVSNNDKTNVIIPLEISGPLHLSYNGWEFVSTIQHLSDGYNIFYSWKNIQIPEHYKTAKSNCEHCKVFRYRLDTYLLFNSELNNYIQVGSSCIKDFLEQTSVGDILAKVNLVASLSKFLEGASTIDCNAETRFYHIREILAQTSACIRDHGWVSKTNSLQSGQQSTVSWVQANILGVGDGLSTPSLEDYKSANQAIDWVESISDAEADKSTYLYNIRTIVRSGMVDWRTMSFAASIIPAFNRSQEASKPITSDYVGTIKSKNIFTLRVKKYFTYNGSYGMIHNYLFEDNESNIFLWSASSQQDFKLDTTYLVKGTIKAHKEFKGVKQTEINRCQIIGPYEV